MKTWLIGAVIVILLLAGAVYFFTQPAAAQPYSDPVSPDFRAANANLYGALVGAGINDSFVDADESHVYVAYELPDGYNSTIIQEFVLGAAASASPNSTTLIAVQYQGGVPTLAWTVGTEDFKAFVRGELTGPQLDAKIQKQNL